ncbi:GDP-mannose 4,6-dehydratase [Gammaproteobacteria bacterium]|nr:GDP-mannose 4,6-dehydratase [Gammaproteobacteria bacterium]
MGNHSKILITGACGFTGRYLVSELTGHDYTIATLKSDLNDRDAVMAEILAVEPVYVVHLAAISSVDEQDASSIYQVNVVGTSNLLDALALLPIAPKKVIVASSANVYGNASESPMETSPLRPVNHYGCSKLSMECIAQNYINKLPIIITRPFNYTGLGHSDNFLIPKIVATYRSNKGVISLGNLDVAREFNDVRDVCEVYRNLLDSSFDSGVINICKGSSITLMNIIDIMNNITGIKMEVEVNPLFVREDEIKILSGDSRKLETIIDVIWKYSIEDTLCWMYGFKK